MSRSMIVGLAAAAAALAALAAPGAARAAEQEEHVRGVIGSVQGDTVTVKTPDGRARQLKLQDQTRVGVATRADVSAITKDAWVGTTAVEAKDGTLRALEVHVFPPTMKGTGEGHHPWDLKPGSTMTNATVSGVEAKGGGASTMTNANVSGVSSAAGGTKLSLTYQGGEKTVIVAPGTPVVKVEPAERSVIAPGQHVFAAGTRQPDGTVLAGRMFVGKDGAVPPM